MSAIWATVSTSEIITNTFRALALHRALFCSAASPPRPIWKRNVCQYDTSSAQQMYAILVKTQINFESYNKLELNKACDLHKNSKIIFRSKNHTTDRKIYEIGSKTQASFQKLLKIAFIDREDCWSIDRHNLLIELINNMAC